MSANWGQDVLEALADEEVSDEEAEDIEPKRMYERHGMYGTSLYMIWGTIKQRCGNPNSGGYSTYGARGIRICDEWSNSFSAFFRYVSRLCGFGKKGYSLDRIDNLGNYEPGNVRWASMAEQTRNTCRNIILSFDGKTQCLQDWANELGISKDAIRGRLKARLPIEQVLSTDVQQRGPTNQTGYKGIKVNRLRKKISYIARICHAGKVIHLGTFDTIEEATRAYTLAAQELGGSSE